MTVKRKERRHREMSPYSPTFHLQFQLFQSWVVSSPLFSCIFLVGEGRFEAQADEAQCCPCVGMWGGGLRGMTDQG